MEVFINLWTFFCSKMDHPLLSDAMTRRSDFATARIESTLDNRLESKYCRFLVQLTSAVVAKMLSKNLTAAAGTYKHQFSCAVKADRSRRPLSVRAQAGPSNPIGIHAQVWVGDWSKDEAIKAIKGTKDAGYDLIERESSRHAQITSLESLKACAFSTPMKLLCFQYHT